MLLRFAERGDDRRRGRVVGVILPAIAGVLAIVGVILLAIRDRPPSFGWIASVPLSSTVYVPSDWYWSPLHASGAILLGLGTLLFWAGWRIAHRGRSNGTRSQR